MTASSTVSHILSEDLKRSGLLPTDIGAYIADETVLAAVGLGPHTYVADAELNCPGYVIPYFDQKGARLPFYRLRLFKPLPKGPKYIQPENTPSRVYFPKCFPELLDTTLKGKGISVVNGFRPTILLCEGEKKAAKAAKEGFLSVAIGGSYGWRTKIISIPASSKITSDKPNKAYNIRLEDSTDFSPLADGRGVLAMGLEYVIDLAIQEDLYIVIAFDSDVATNDQVQRAAAELGLELRSHGIPTSRIKQLTIPPGKSTATKVGLDDLLVAEGKNKLLDILERTLHIASFPKHPNIKWFVNKTLAAQPLDRHEIRDLAVCIVADLDARGSRLIDKATGLPFYFDAESKRLMHVNLLHHHQEPLHETDFGTFLYKTYDLSQFDSRLIQWLAAAFTGEKDIANVEPRSVLALVPGEDKLAAQINGGQFVVVSGDSEHPIEVCDNGSMGLMFRSDQVEDLDADEVLKAVKEQSTLFGSNKQWKFEDLWWRQAINQFKFSKPEQVELLTLLFYISPWLLRWRGTQLPVELMIGEPGSGKSSMYSLRMLVLTGRPTLRNLPTDIRDWYASITSSDGIHVTDNVHIVNKEMKQRLSDEICRITTEPHPFVEMRRLFTTAQNYRIPVRTTFAMTAIQQPFMNADILQRSLVIELQAIGKEHKGDWDTNQLEARGGRVKWLAHQLWVLHRVLNTAQSIWKSNFKSDHRLANLEQLFLIAGKALRCQEVEQIAGHLGATIEEQVSEYDWTMEALKEFCAEHIAMLQRDPRKAVNAADIAAWAGTKEAYVDNSIVTSSRRLGRYIKSHAFMVEQATGLFEFGNFANRTTYRIKTVKRP